MKTRKSLSQSVQFSQEFPEPISRNQMMRAILNHLAIEGGQSCCKSHDTIRIWSRPGRLGPLKIGTEPPEEPEMRFDSPPVENGDGEMRERAERCVLDFTFRI